MNRKNRREAEDTEMVGGGGAGDTEKEMRGDVRREGEGGRELFF